MTRHNHPRRSALRKLTLLGAGLLALGCAAPVLAAPKPPPGGRETPSGLPVPRYVSLKFDKVNARRGPGDDYPLMWVYRAKNLPVQVVAETEEWRRVCDPEGSLTWIHRRTADARRTVMNTRREPVVMHRAPREDSPPAAELVGRALADLKDCKGDWCKISAGHASGWVKARDVWGAVEAPQCREH